jgi:hypothetical protein
MNGGPMATGGPQQRIEAYLNSLRRCLRGVAENEVREIVEELRSHIVEKAAAGGVSGELTVEGVEATIAALGSPEELAAQYLTDNLLARVEVSRSPVKILRNLFRWASLSIAGFWVLLGAVIGYFFGIVFVLVAVAKLFHPHTAGLWILPSDSGGTNWSFRLGFGSVPAGARDALGWWIVPMGWFGGGALVMLTTQIAVWYVRQYRRARTVGSL